MGTTKKFAKSFIHKFLKDKVTLLAAGQAYYYLLSILPLLVIGFAIIPYLNLQTSQAVQFLDTIVPGKLASVFEKDISKFIETPHGGILTIAIIGVFWTASNAMNALIKSINIVYEVKEARPILKVRILATALTLGMLLALIFAMFIPVFGSALLGFIKNHLSVSSSFINLFHALRWVIGFILLTLFLIILYRLAPSMKLPIYYIIPGALTASILWEITSFGFSFYVTHFGNYSAVYGGLGGIIIIMIWFFLTGVTLMIGAMVNILIYEFKH
ncbi:MAG TPA: YihY/virulence factor BrkB family protein [Pseudogracilibacillus sp.]|nr:YihY/virulence factor BrkB family protein [Pseudogracilibacillus sp.]